MFVPFDQLSDQARLWVYPMDRPATKEEMAVIEYALMDFCKEWKAHGFPLKASFCIRHRHFVLLAVDEAAGEASGCSIDSSVRIFKFLQQQTGIDFMDRTQSAFWINDRVVLFPNNQLKGLFEDGTLTASTPTFNHLVNCKVDLDVNWVMPAGQTWLVRYIRKGSLV